MSIRRSADKMVVPCFGPVLSASLLASTISERPDRNDWDPGSATTSVLDSEIHPDRERASGDGVHGRFDGNLDVALHVGAHWDARVFGAASALTAHYFSMAGIFASYADHGGNDDAQRTRIASVGVDLRPVFIPRWSQNITSGTGISDLALDSLSLQLGAYWAKPNEGDFGSDRGFETSLGVGVPLTGRAPGPWANVRGLLRWRDADGRESSASGAVLMTLSWHVFATVPFRTVP